MSARPSFQALVAIAAALVAAACSDPTSGPAAVGPRPAGGPALGVVSAAGSFLETMNFAGAVARFDTTFGVATDGPPPSLITPVWALIPPAPWKPSDFDVAIHVRDRSAWDVPETFRAMHGTLCQPYDDGTDVARPNDGITHEARTYDDLNYRCRNHMMTAIRASGYGVVYVTPNALVDFRGGEAVIRWAMSTFRTSAEDWIDLWVSPWEDNLKLPLDGALGDVDLQGPPRRAIHVRMTATSATQSAFEASYVEGHRETRLASVTTPYESILTPTSTRRDTFELRISRTHVRFGMWKGDVRAPAFGIPEPYAAVTWVDAALPAPLDWGLGVVQFGHHSMGQTATGVGGTWHWDDFSFSRAVPFTMLRATNPDAPTATNDRFAESKRPDVTLAQPTPAAGHLRFAAYGDKVQVSYDGGKWMDAVRQPTLTSTEGRFASYWTPIPAGVSRVSFKAKKDKAATESTQKDDGAWRVRDVSVWIP